MKDDEHKWVNVDLTNSPSPSRETERMRVPGGWIYKHHSDSSWAIVFVPEPAAA
jgi:hypothetical protein